ncbi:MAG: HipA N-terminal domain-containing protein [Rikenellaceae bacterium]
MKRAKIYSKGRLAGVLTESDVRDYTFEYDVAYLADNDVDSISLTLPKRSEPYKSSYLFPFFSNMLSEGDNRSVQCSLLHIDENDEFELLLATASVDTIGAITIQRYERD